MKNQCPECGVHLPEGKTCLDYFHQLLALEAELPVPDLEAHFYSVSAFNLQHPIITGLSSWALSGLKDAVLDLLHGRTTLAQVRWKAREGAAKEGGLMAKTAAREASFSKASASINILDILENGTQDYRQKVEKWAKAAASEF